MPIYVGEIIYQETYMQTHREDAKLRTLLSAVPLDRHVGVVQYHLNHMSISLIVLSYNIYYYLEKIMFCSLFILFYNCFVFVFIEYNFGSREK